LLDKQAIEKEINAVDSEFQKNYLNDSVRNFHLFSQLSNPDGLFNMFADGNKQTLLKEDIHEQVLKFYETHYR
jgi:secreted Zn-dependent insulinase-like peptidase